MDKWAAIAIVASFAAQILLYVYFIGSKSRQIEQHEEFNRQTREDLKELQNKLGALSVEVSFVRGKMNGEHRLRGEET